MKSNLIKFTIGICPDDLKLLANTLNDFEEIAPELECLEQTIEGEYGLVTDGEYSIIVNSEGYTYGRYKSDRIKNEVLELLFPSARNFVLLTHRKHTSLDTIETTEALERAIGR